MLLFRWHKNKFEGFDFDNILTDEKSHENILICDISCKTLTDLKPLHIRFDKINGLIRIYDGTRYLILLTLKNMMLFITELDILKDKKLVPPMFLLSNFGKIKIDSYDSLPIEKTFILHNVAVLITSVVNKDQYHFYYNIFLEKWAYQIGKKYQIRKFYDSIIMLILRETK